MKTSNCPGQLWVMSSSGHWSHTLTTDSSSLARKKRVAGASECRYDQKCWPGIIKKNKLHCRKKCRKKSRWVEQRRRRRRRPQKEDMKKGRRRGVRDERRGRKGGGWVYFWLCTSWNLLWCLHFLTYGAGKQQDRDEGGGSEKHDGWWQQMMVLRMHNIPLLRYVSTPDAHTGPSKREKKKKSKNHLTKPCNLGKSHGW